MKSGTGPRACASGVWCTHVVFRGSRRTFPWKLPWLPWKWWKLPWKLLWTSTRNTWIALLIVATKCRPTTGLIYGQQHAGVSIATNDILFPFVFAHSGFGWGAWPLQPNCIRLRRNWSWHGDAGGVQRFMLYVSPQPCGYGANHTAGTVCVDVVFCLCVFCFGFCASHLSLIVDLFIWNQRFVGSDCASSHPLTSGARGSHNVSARLTLPPALCLALCSRPRTLGLLIFPEPRA